MTRWSVGADGERFAAESTHDKEGTTMTEHAHSLTVAREYLNARYAGLYNVTRMRDYPDGSRLYGTPLWGPEGPVVSCRVSELGHIHGTPEHTRATKLAQPI